MQIRTHIGAALVALFAVCSLSAQAPPPHTRNHRAAAKPVAALPQPVPAPVPPSQPVNQSLLDQPATPAQVELEAGKLSVKANNSTLSGILHDISLKTGMSVDGLSRDQRIFGNYGPAQPREVLSALLDGLGYNVMMVGALDNGAPRTLTLTPRIGGASTAKQQRSMPMARENNANEDDEDSAPEQPEPPVPPRPETVAPENNPAPEQQPGNTPPQIRTPQQMLQELQQMRQKQMDQQQTNPQ